MLNWWDIADKSSDLQLHWLLHTSSCVQPDCTRNAEKGCLVDSPPPETHRGLLQKHLLDDGLLLEGFELGYDEELAHGLQELVDTPILCRQKDRRRLWLSAKCSRVSAVGLVWHPTSITYRVKNNPDPSNKEKRQQNNEMRLKKGSISKISMFRYQWQESILVGTLVVAE